MSATFETLIDWARARLPRLLCDVGSSFEFPYSKDNFKDRYTRQSRWKPCSTIVAHLSKDGLMFIHPTQRRSLTPREAARIQSFPDWFAFPVPQTQQFRLIGNAVPPLVGEAVGAEVKTFLRAATKRQRQSRKKFRESTHVVRNLDTSVTTHRCNLAARGFGDGSAAAALVRKVAVSARLVFTVLFVPEFASAECVGSRRHRCGVVAGTDCPSWFRILWCGSLREERLAGRARTTRHRGLAQVPRRANSLTRNSIVWTRSGSGFLLAAASLQAGGRAVSALQGDNPLATPKGHDSFRRLDDWSSRSATWGMTSPQRSQTSLTTPSRPQRDHSERSMSNSTATTPGSASQTTAME